MPLWFQQKNSNPNFHGCFCNQNKFYGSFLLIVIPSIRDRVLRSGMLLYLHHRDSKIFFHPAKFDNFRDEKISDYGPRRVVSRSCF